MQTCQTARAALFAALVFAGFPAAGHALTEEEGREGFVSLFNGSDLSGWKIMGNEKAWVIEDGMIHAIPGYGGDYIRSEAEFEDFILRLEYKTGENANSGVFIHVPEHGRESRVGGEVQIHDSYGREPSKSGAGAIYDVLPPLVNASRQPGEWHELEIHFEYPALKVTLNGTLVQDLDLTEHPRLRWRKRYGPIGLQEHGNHAWFRNVRIKDLGGNHEERWQHLFNGVNLDGWTPLGDTDWRARKRAMVLVIKDQSEHPSQWDRKFDTAGPDWFSKLGNAKVKFKDAAIVGGDRPGWLVSDKEYKDFELWAYVKTDLGARGGIQIRWKSQEDPGHTIHILNDRREALKTGSIDGKEPASGITSSDGDWFPMQIIAKGKTVTAIVNGLPVAEYSDANDRPGHIALWIADRRSRILFKDVKIQGL